MKCFPSRRAVLLLAALAAAPLSGGCRIFAGYDSARSDGSQTKDGGLDGPRREGGIPIDGPRDEALDGAQDGAVDGHVSDDAPAWLDSGSGDAGPPPIAGACSPGGWCWENQRPTGNDLTAVAGLAAGAYLVVGDAATILHFDGTTWSTIARPAFATGRPKLTAIWATSLQDFAVAGANGTVWVRDNGAWSDRSFVPLGNITGLWSGAGQLWVSSDVGLYHLPALMGSWQTKQSVALRGLWAASPTEGVAIGGEQVYRFDGTSFSCSSGALDCKTGATTKKLQGIWGFSASEIYAGSVDGCIYEITKTACTAVWRGEPTYAQFSALWGSTPQDIVAVGGLTRGHYNGSAWTWDPAFAEGMAGIGGHVSSPAHALGASSRGRLFGFAATSGWRKVNEDVSASWLQSVAELGGELWAAGGELRRRDAQGHWKGLAGPGGGQVIAMGGTGPQAAWLLRAPASSAGPGSLVHGRPGLFQTVTTLPSSFDPQSLYVDASGVAWVAGHDSAQASTRARLFKLGGPTANPSEIGIDVNVSLPGRVQGLWVRPNGDLFLVTDGGSLAARIGVDWDSVNSGAFHALWADDTVAVAVGRSGSQGWTAVHQNGGWNIQNQPGLPLNGVYGGGTPRRIYAVGDAGLIFGYEATGWKAQESGVAGNLSGVTFAKDGAAYVVGNEGKILRHAPGP